MIGFGLTSYSSTFMMFTILSFMFRFLQGWSSWSIQTTSYAIVSVTFPLEQEKYIALIETSVGVGLILGPVIGSTIYAFAGFSMTFFIIGGAFIILTPTLYWLLPNSINKKTHEHENDADLHRNLLDYNHAEAK